MKLDNRVLAVAALVVTVSLYLFSTEQCSVFKPVSGTAADMQSASLMTSHTPYSNDTNWAGYLVASDIQNPEATVTSVSASWTVPAVNISAEDTFSAIWIGIGGFFDETLIQTGTEQDSTQGQSEYSAWLELLPQTSITINSISVSPGDQITASIQLVNTNTDQWSISIRDLTSNQQYTGSFTYSSSQLSAEWMVERPDVSTRRSRGTLSSLADVGTVEFTNCQTTIGGETGTISSFPTVQSIMYESVKSTTDSGSTLLAVVSDLTDNGASFRVETSITPGMTQPPFATPTPTAAPEISELSLWIILPIVTIAALLTAAVYLKKSKH